jgi:GGDEF domain-containing protein
VNGARIKNFLEAIQRNHSLVQVYYANIADLKRRNLHLGVAQGDRDILELSELLKTKVIGAKGIVEQVGGAEWLFALPNNATNLAGEIVRDFHQQKNIQIGWRASAHKGTEEIAKSEEMIAATIFRSLRIGFLPVSAIKNIHDVEEFANKTLKLDPDLLTDLSALAGSESRKPWSCVNAVVAELKCPTCKSQDLEFDEGTSNLLSATCRSCKALIEVEFL